MRLGRKEIAHLYNRAAFGLDFESFQKLSFSNANQLVKRLFSESFQPNTLNVFGAMPQLEISRKVRSGEFTREEARAEIRKAVDESREKIRDLNVTWIQQMQDSKTAGLEKLVFFWHDHFGVRVLNGYLAQQHNNTLRTHALRSFKELLLAVARDPAMLSFLNNQQNKKSMPNENFARELMELFTIGRGNYTEQDVKEAARAFTGWRIDRRTGKFIFDRRNHDFGQKRFFNQKGDFNGEEIIDIILSDKRTADFLATKFYLYYVEDTPNSTRISELSDYYYTHNYDTGSLLAFLFTREWFYEESVQRSKIKSPISLINSLHVQMGLGFNNPLAWIVLQRNFNQVLFYPPSVAGWPTGREWIDSSSLVKRMQLPAAIAGMSMQIDDLPEIDASDPFKSFDRKRVLRSASFRNQQIDFSASNDKEALDMMIEFLLGGRLEETMYQKTLAQMAATPNHLKVERVMTVLASLPEFQMI